MTIEIVINTIEDDVMEELGTDEFPASLKDKIASVLSMYRVAVLNEAQRELHGVIDNAIGRIK